MSQGADAVLHAVRALYEAMHRFDGRVADALGIHRSDLRCLNALERGGLTAGEIGARLGLTSGSVTALVDRLVRAGLVERAPDPADRRRALVVLQPASWARLDVAYAALGRTIGSELASATAGDLGAATRVVAALASAFDGTGAPAPTPAESPLPPPP